MDLTPGKKALLRMALAAGTEEVQPLVTDFVLKYRGAKDTLAQQMAAFEDTVDTLETNLIAKLEELGFSIPPKPDDAKAEPPATSSPLS